MALLASYLSIKNLSGYPLDGPLPEMPPTAGIQSRQQLIIDLGRRENLSIRQLARHFAGARGHWQLIGTPSHIADEMEARFRGSGADGFNIMPPLFPGGLEDLSRSSSPNSVAVVFSGRVMREQRFVRIWD